MESKFSLMEWLKKFDRWIIFDPIRWPYREVIGRGTALLIVLGFLALRVHQFNLFPQSFADAHTFYAGFKTAGGQPVYTLGQIIILWGVRLGVWLVETGIYLGYIASYISRAKAKNVAKGFLETAFPVFVAGIPLVLAFMPYSLPNWAPYSSPSHLYFYLAIMALSMIGGFLNLIGLMTLRRAFTIMSEARELIVHGIFSRIRHPLYTGHFIMFFGSLALRLHVASVIIYLVFCLGQVARARIEERKLIQTFPEYGQYKRRTGMFFPRRLK